MPGSWRAGSTDIRVDGKGESAAVVSLRASLLVICLETTPQSVSEPLSAKSERGSANQNQSSGPQALGCSLVLQNTPLRRASSFLVFFLPHDREQAVQSALPQPCSPVVGCRASRESKASLGPVQAARRTPSLPDAKNIPAASPGRAHSLLSTPHGLPPLRSATRAIGMRDLPSIKFSDLSAYASYRPLGPAGGSRCPAPPSPPAFRPQEKVCWLLPRVPGFCRQNSCKGPAWDRCTPHRVGLSLLCCCFRVFLSMGSGSWFRENVGGLLSKVCSY